MKRSSLILLVILGLIAAALAVANRQDVTIRFNPFDRGDVNAAVTMPVYELVFLVFIFGAIAGGGTVAIRRLLSDRAKRRATKMASTAVTPEPRKTDTAEPAP